jgi:hypothetical protein
MSTHDEDNSRTHDEDTACAGGATRVPEANPLRHVQALLRQFVPDALGVLQTLAEDETVDERTRRRAQVALERALRRKHTYEQKGRSR